MNKIIKILIIVLAILLLMIALFFSSNSFSNFFSKIGGNSNTEVATPIFILESSEKKVLNDENTEIDYYFTVKNFDSNNNRSETDLKYTIEVTPELDPSIKLTLYKDGNITSFSNQKTSEIDLKQESNQTHSFRLNVKYEREKTGITTDIKENIYIKASAKQS